MPAVASILCYFRALFSSRPERGKKKLAQLRQCWGQEVGRIRNWDNFSSLDRFLPPGPERVDQATWEDLGMDEVFCRLDRTITPLGAQALYARLRVYEKNPSVLTERTSQYNLFRKDAGLREKVQAILIELSHPSTEYLAPLLLSPFPPLPRLAWLLCLLSALPLACLIGAAFFPLLYLGAFVFVCVNTVIYITYGQKITPHFHAFAQINTLLAVSAKLGRIQPSEAVPEITYLRTVHPLIQQLRKRLGLLSADRTALPDLAQAVVGYLNMFFLFDVLIFLRSVRALQQAQTDLVKIMRAVGSLDANLAAASYLEDAPYHCVPNFEGSARRIQIVGLYHPMLTSPVANDLTLDQRSAFISGPNMAGKTAFIRTVGINLLLAQTLNICLAREASLPRIAVRSMIEREDSLAEGASYFFTEIRRIHEFTQIPPSASPQLLLIDEIFRGTNSIERIAASVAVLRHLGRDHLVLVTSHDSALATYLAEAFDAYHFTDRVVDNTYGFDYLIHRGPVRTRNAIKLLGIVGFDQKILHVAADLARELDAE